MRRGFKTEAEKHALEARALVGLPGNSPLPARALAKAMGVVVSGPTDIPELPQAVAAQMLIEYAHVWSALTFKCEDSHFIVHNTTHIPPRQESDVMHELAHIWCKHKPEKIEPVGRLPWATRTYNPDQEEEAKWLGGCFQIPRDSLVWFIQRRHDNTAIAAHFGASEEMVRYRRNLTGVDTQVARSAAFRKPRARVQ